MLHFNHLKCIYHLLYNADSIVCHHVDKFHNLFSNELPIMYMFVWYDRKFYKLGLKLIGVF